MSGDRDPYELLTRAEVAAKLRCNVAHVSYLTKTKQLQCVRVGRRILVPLAVFEAYVRGGDQPESDGNWPPTMPLFDMPGGDQDGAA